MIPRVRAAGPADAQAIRPLLAQLGDPAEAAAAAERLGALAASNRDAVLVAEDAAGGAPLVGVAAVHWGATPLHLPGPVARTGTLVVADGARLLREAEALARDRGGCTAVEVTTGRDRHATHAFYAAQGYAWASLRSAKGHVGT